MKIKDWDWQHSLRRLMRMEDIQRSTGEFENAEVQITYQDISFKVSKNTGICNNPDDPYLSKILSCHPN